MRTFKHNLAWLFKTKINWFQCKRVRYGSCVAGLYQRWFEGFLIYKKDREDSCRLSFLRLSHPHGSCPLKTWSPSEEELRCHGHLTASAGAPLWAPVPASARPSRQSWRAAWAGANVQVLLLHRTRSHFLRKGGMDVGGGKSRSWLVPDDSPHGRRVLSRVSGP